MAGNSPSRADKGLEIRTAKPEDLEEIYEIERLSFKFPYPPSLLKSYLAICKDLFIVACLRGRVVGYAISLIRCGSVGHLVSIAVHPSFRRRGIGRLLLKESIERLKRKGVRGVRLEVRVSNSPAISLYHSYGFRVVGRIRKYYLDGEDCYVMYLDLVNERG